MNEFRDTREHRPGPSGRNVLVGLIVVAVGVVILLKQLHFPFFPYWIFSWPMILIIIGLVIGVKSDFRNVSWLIMVLLGGFFLLDHVVIFNWHLNQYAWPIGIIVIGIFLIFRSVISPSQSYHDYNKDNRYGGGLSDPTDETSDEKKNTMNSGDDYINSTNIFGGTKKRIFSKSFRGGQTTNFFGGTEIDLTQADLNKVAVIDLVQVFGGIKLIMPANWEVKSEVVSIFGGLNDKRNMPSSTQDTSKMVVLTGVCIFGGIDIKSY